jgi:hypothetical protein
LADGQFLPERVTTESLWGVFDRKFSVRLRALGIEFGKVSDRAVESGPEAVCRVDCELDASRWNGSGSGDISQFIDSLRKTGLGLELSDLGLSITFANLNDDSVKVLQFVSRPDGAKSEL